MSIVVIVSAIMMIYPVVSTVHFVLGYKNQLYAKIYIFLLILVTSLSFYAYLTGEHGWPWGILFVITSIVFIFARKREKEKKELKEGKIKEEKRA